ncbi:MAG: energy transducer TonB [bacterium]
MSEQIKAFIWSIFIHILIIIGVSHFIFASNKVIFIDFIIEKNSCLDRQSEVIIRKRQEKIIKKKTVHLEKKGEEKQKLFQTSLVTPLVFDEQVVIESPKIENEPSHTTESSEIQNNSENSVTKADTGSIEQERIKYFKEHFAYIKDIIMKNLSYPLVARRMGLIGRVVVSFVIFENGSVEDIRIKQGSGFDILDKKAVETIKKVAPFPKPPMKAEIILPIVYELN